MTFKQLGQAAKKSQTLIGTYGRDFLDTVPDEILADRILAKWPEYWSLISPQARRIREIAERPKVGEGLFAKTRHENRRLALDNDAAEVELLHRADMLIEASGQAVPVEALGPIAVLTHQTNEQIRLRQAEARIQVDTELARRDLGLDGRDRVTLTKQYLLQDTRQRLLRVIDLRDRETHPLKREVYEEEIKYLREELRARGQQEVVQAGDGAGLRHDNEDSDSGRSRQESPETDGEPVSAAKPGIGFRR